MNRRIRLALTVVLTVCSAGVVLGPRPLLAEDESAPNSGDRVSLRAGRPSHAPRLADRLADQVTIYRDTWGVPHIDAESDEAAIFGYAYAQAEDFYWQVEDNYILSLGRYCEVHGIRGMNSDLLNRAFEITRLSQEQYGAASEPIRRLCQAYAAGLNYYLETHPEVESRLINHYEPWHMFAFQLHMTVELTYRYTRLSNSFLPRQNNRIWAATGSNAWAISGRRTLDGHAMLMANPHLPWYGFAQLYEAHLRSKEGMNFTGVTFHGGPFPVLGHNEAIAWTLTTNEPDVGDVWRVTFDHESDPLKYRYGDGYRRATAWDETIRVRTPKGMEQRTFKMRKTHHGPIVGKEDDQTFLAAQLAGVYFSKPAGQSIAMIKARNLPEFKSALSMMQLPYTNIIYADRDDNIFYVYNGIVPRRDPRLDWSKPVDGADPRNDWQDFHSLDELPQSLNPPSGFIQNCNSTPFTTADDGNPNPGDFPSYMIEDRHDDKRRAKRSREMLRAMDNLTLEQLEGAVFDTELYWARHELPKYEAMLKELKQTKPALARQAKPLLDTLLAWDCRVTEDSVAATLCQAWYENLYGTEYPGEKLRDHFVDRPDLQFEALINAAASLSRMHGIWQIPYGKVYRIQREPFVADVLEAHNQDNEPSLSATGAHGPMGTIFTQYYTPSVNIPFVMTQKKRYGVVGTTYLAAYEMASDGPRGASLVQFGQSGDPASPHYFDQAHLLSEHRLKPILFDWDEIAAQAVRVYRPGESARQTARSPLPKTSAR